MLNGRPVRDTLLVQTLLDAYRPTLGRDQFPVAVLRIDLPPQDVDVNVHPTKAWVRLRQPRLVQEAVYLAVQSALASERVVQRQAGLAAAAPAGLAARRAGAPAGGTGPGDAPTGQGALFREAPAAFGAPRFGAVIGQLQDTFVVAASDEEVFFIDQHVAHERVLFERLKRDLDGRPLPAQELLFPEPIDLAPRPGRALVEWAPTLRALGFEVERFGEGAVLLRAVPVLLRRRSRGASSRPCSRRWGARRGENGRWSTARSPSWPAAPPSRRPRRLGREEMARLVADLPRRRRRSSVPTGGRS